MSRAVMSGYLQRLGIDAIPNPSWPVLCDLVTRHIHLVPFENLDIINGLQSELSTDAVLHKVVTRRRGGFCYELNEAFGALLSHLGFDVRRIEARVWSQRLQEFGPPFDHLALSVSLPQGEYLTDVGFGDNNRTPLRLPADTLTDVSGEYSLERLAPELWLLSRPGCPLYRMTVTEQPLAAFAAMYRHHRTSPRSKFTQSVICTRATPTGRVTFSRDRLIVVDGANRTETKPDRDEALETYFGLIKENPAC